MFLIFVSLETHTVHIAHSAPRFIKHTVTTVISVFLQPRAPWEPRMFPLDKDKEEALLCYDLEKVPAGWQIQASLHHRTQTPMLLQSTPLVLDCPLVNKPDE